MTTFGGPAPPSSSSSSSSTTTTHQHHVVEERHHHRRVRRGFHDEKEEVVGGGGIDRFVAQQQQTASASATSADTFEWLTNFTTLAPLLSPSYLFGDDDDGDDGRPSSFDASDGNDECGGTHCRSKEKKKTAMTRRQRRKRTALHVGCGTSTVGEDLIERLGYKRVVNVDVDVDVLRTMERRWIEKTAAGAHTARRRREKDGSGCDGEQTDGRGDDDDDDCDDDDDGACDNGVMEFLRIDFGNESDLETLRRSSYSSTESTRTAAGTGSRGSGGSEDAQRPQPPPEKFDVVLDKSTLDCLLCADGNAIAGLISAAHGSLRVPASMKKTTKGSCDDGCDGCIGGDGGCGGCDDRWGAVVSDDGDADGGGVYVVVSFHHPDLVVPLLKDCPGTDWDVDHRLVDRAVDVVPARRRPSSSFVGGDGDGDDKERSSWSRAVVAIGADDDHTERSSRSSAEEKGTSGRCSGNHLAVEVEEEGGGRGAIEGDDGRSSEEPKSAWSDGGTFDPDPAYRRTVHVYTCRRRRRRQQQQGGSAEDRNNNIGNDDCENDDDDDIEDYPNLDAVKEHVRETCDAWYRTSNPLATRARLSDLRRLFDEALLRSIVDPVSYVGNDGNDGNDVHEDDEKKEENDDDGNASPPPSLRLLLPLKECYGVLFTDAEREHLTYEHFLEDWKAFSQERRRRRGVVDDGGDEGGISRDGMTFEVAVDFLEEMQ